MLRPPTCNLATTINKLKFKTIKIRNRYTAATAIRRWQLSNLSAADASNGWREDPPAQGECSRQLLLATAAERGPLRELRLAREGPTSRTWLA